MVIIPSILDYFRAVLYTIGLYVNSQLCSCILVSEVVEIEQRFDEDR